MTTSVASILLVEDDPLLRHAFRLLLEDAGYRVREAGTGQDALEFAGSDTPDLIILDLGLPDLHGLDVARRLRAETPTRDIPIVALTGRSGDAEKRACFDAGCSHYFAKPVEPRELLRRLPEILKR